jgi:hypothetical protein
MFSGPGNQRRALCEIHAIIHWARTDSGKRIPLDPWPRGFTVTRSHFPGRCPRRSRRDFGLSRRKLRPADWNFCGFCCWVLPFASLGSEGLSLM